jgi:hypothetical protein
VARERKAFDATVDCFKRGLDGVNKRHAALNLDGVSQPQDRMSMVAATKMRRIKEHQL